MKQTSVPNTDNNSKSQLSKKSDDSNSSKWQVKKLGELCEVLDKLRKPITKRDRIEGEYPYYGATGILSYINNFIFSEKLVLIGEDGAKWESGDKTSFIAEGKYWVNNHAHVIKPNRELVLDEWIVCFLNFSDLRPFITGMTVPKLNQEKMRSIPIPLPPLAEQKAIVAVLDEAFGEIEKVKANTEQNLKNAKEIFESYLQGVFENKGDDWEEKKLGEVADIVNGGTPKTNVKEYWDGDIYWITPADLGKLDSPIVYNTRRKISSLGLQKSSAKLFPKNSVILSTRAPIGHLAVNKVEMSTNQGCRGIVPREKLDTWYLYYFLKKNVNLLNDLGTGTTFKELSKSVLSDIYIPLPSLKEQQTIVRQLDALRAETQKLEVIYTQKLSDLEELKKSLLQKAFSGEF
jgi:type I restriction enzyme S subunit